MISNWKPTTARNHEYMEKYILKMIGNHKITNVTIRWNDLYIETSMNKQFGVSVLFIVFMYPN